MSHYWLPKIICGTRSSNVNTTQSMIHEDEDIKQFELISFSILNVFSKLIIFCTYNNPHKNSNQLFHTIDWRLDYMNCRITDSKVGLDDERRSCVRNGDCKLRCHGKLHHSRLKVSIHVLQMFTRCRGSWA